jgi:hypothetical protein
MVKAANRTADISIICSIQRNTEHNKHMKESEFNCTHAECKRNQEESKRAPSIQGMNMH